MYDYDTYSATPNCTEYSCELGNSELCIVT